MTITPGAKYAAQMEQAKQMGMGDFLKPMVHEVVNPDWRRAVQELRMPMMKNYQIKFFDAKLISVTKGPTLATYLDAPEVEREADKIVRQQLAMQAAQWASSMVSNIAGAVAGGPVGMISAAIEMGIMNPATQAAMAQAQSHNKMKEEVGVNRWKCRPFEPQKGVGTQQPPVKDAKFLGTGQTAGQSAKIYQFTARDASTKMDLPVTVFVSAGSGLPLRMELSMKEGGMAMDYYDIDAPIKIERPDCMK